MAEAYTPIRTVDGKAVKCPSSYQWKLEDVSASDAGRTEDTQMDNMRMGQVIGLELAWQNATIEEAAEVLQAFNPEYITVSYLDAMIGRWVEKEFYVGNRTAPLYNCTLGVWSNISFNIIERKAKTFNSLPQMWDDTIPATGGV